MDDIELLGCIFALGSWPNVCYMFDFFYIQYTWACESKAKCYKLLQVG